MTGLNCLVTGATGYIGGRLVPELLDAGHRVRCMARTPGKLRDHPWAGRAEVVAGDVSDRESVAEALRGIDVAYYLVHALGGGSGFEDRDRTAARTFAEEARIAGVRRIVYLGGLTPTGIPVEELSPHLRSRAEVGDILLAGAVPATVLRAAVIIGSGSASFEMLRYLTERLPVMVTPSWVNTRCQPIGVRDVLRYLVAGATMPPEVDRTFDIGGPDVLTYEEMMRRYAEVAQLPRRLILRVPMLTPRLSSHWIGLVTPVPRALARPLAESLRHEVVCSEHDIARYAPDPPGSPIGFDQALELALRKVREAEVDTRWSSASLPGAPSDPLPTDPDWAGGSLYTDLRGRDVGASPEALWRVVEGIGGENGWYSFPGLVGARLARPARRRGRHPARPARRGPAAGGRLPRLLAGGGDRTGPAAAAARGDAAAGPGLAGDVRGTVPGRHRRRAGGPVPAAGAVPPARAARPPVLVERVPVPRRGLRGHGPQHRPRRRTARRGDRIRARRRSRARRHRTGGQRPTGGQRRSRPRARIRWRRCIRSGARRRSIRRQPSPTDLTRSECP